MPGGFSPPGPGKPDGFSKPAPPPELCWMTEMGGGGKADIRNEGEEGRGTSTLLVILREGPGEGRVEGEDGEEGDGSDGDDDEGDDGEGFDGKGGGISSSFTGFSVTIVGG